MKKIDNILKIKEYDKFKCIADKCKFTCCKGWDINVDTNTYNKWKEKSELNYLLDNVRFIKSNGENSYL
ncbi:MAG: lysine-N-methylase, partial [Clostridium sp.]|nr:lysine-N-methylase [Clostridium sp.]